MWSSGRLFSDMFVVEVGDAQLQVQGSDGLIRSIKLGQYQR